MPPPSASAEPLPGLHYDSLRAQLRLPAPAPNAHDDDWGAPSPHTPYKRAHCNDEALFERRLANACGPEAVDIDVVRREIVGNAQRAMNEYVKKKRSDEKRRVIEQTLREVATTQIVQAKHMLAELE